jgi:hypothetical protein
LVSFYINVNAIKVRYLIENRGTIRRDHYNAEFTGGIANNLILLLNLQFQLFQRGECFFYGFFGIETLSILGEKGSDTIALRAYVRTIFKGSIHAFSDGLKFL